MQFWTAKIERNKERDERVQRELAKMGWHSMTIWECELKHGVREKTLEALAYTLNRIFLNDNTVKYALPEDDGISMAAETKPDDTYNAKSTDEL